MESAWSLIELIYSWFDLTHNKFLWKLWYKSLVLIDEII